jgi:DNA-binding FadR family transcriptional regulator
MNVPLTESQQNPKMADSIARQLVREILDLDLPIGKSLPNEKAMLETLGVARPTLREALRLLESNGSIVMKTGRGGGPIVRKPRATDVGRLLSLLLEFEGMAVTEVFEARLLLEPILLHLAAERVSDDDLARLEILLDEMGRSTEDSEAFSKAGEEFHNVAVAASGVPVLAIVEQALRSISPAMSRTYTQERRAESVESHRMILESIRSGNAVSAESGARAHLQAAITYCELHITEFGDQRIEWVE